MATRRYRAGTKEALVDAAQGQCYFPGCTRALIAWVNDEPIIDYDIAHIYDLNEGNRHDPSMTEEELNSFSNLLLLCRPHHKEIDSRNPDNYPAGVLLTWKTQRDPARREGYEELGRLTPGELEAGLLDVVVNITDSDVSLGGQGGRVPGAGGGGGGAIGPGARGGRGGDGGDYFNMAIPATAGEVFEVEVGEGGAEGRPGGDSVLRRVLPSGEKQEVVRTAGGGSKRKPVATGSGPLRVAAAFISHSSYIAGGLVSALGAGWDHWRASELPAAMSAAVVVIVEAVELGLIDAEVRVQLVNPTDRVVETLDLPVEFEATILPHRVSCSYGFVATPVDSVGLWKFDVVCEGKRIHSIPFQVRTLDR